MTESRLVLPINVRDYEEEIASIQDWNKFGTHYARLRAAAQAVADCTFTLDPTTIPKGGVDAAPSRVRGEIRIGLLKHHDLVKALSSEEEPMRYNEFGAVGTTRENQ